MCEDMPPKEGIFTCTLSHVSTPVMYSTSGTKVFAFGCTTMPSMSKSASMNCDTIGPELTPGQSVLNRSCIGSMLPSASLEMLSPLKASKPSRFTVRQQRGKGGGLRRVKTQYTLPSSSGRLSALPHWEGAQRANHEKVSRVKGRNLSACYLRPA